MKNVLLISVLTVIFANCSATLPSPANPPPTKNEITPNPTPTPVPAPAEDEAAIKRTAAATEKLRQLERDSTATALACVLMMKSKEAEKNPPIVYQILGECAMRFREFLQETNKLQSVSNDPNFQVNFKKTAKHIWVLDMTYHGILACAAMSDGNQEMDECAEKLFKKIEAEQLKE